jgi:hypothetical protein
MIRRRGSENFSNGKLTDGGRFHGARFNANE